LEIGHLFLGVLMQLSELLKAARVDAVIQHDREVANVTTDSRDVVQGSVFIAVKGVHHNGNAFVRQAIEHGAIAIVTDGNDAVPVPERDAVLDTQGVTTIIANNPYALSAQLAAAFCDFPARKLNLIGITGTNGKTTISYLLEAIYQAHHQATGVIGTINYRVGSNVYPSVNTTPQPTELQTLLHEMVTHHVHTVIMEVSSHALALKRVEGCEFDVAVFTNLTQDHLDFHGTMDAYFLAKKMLFDSVRSEQDAQKTVHFPRCVVLNRDDAHAKYIAKDVQVPIVWYGLNEKHKDKNTVYAKNIHYNMQRYMMECELVFDAEQTIRIQTPLLGAYNVSNICAAAGVAYFQKIPLDVIKQGIERVAAVPGRFEFIREGQSFACVVDYAHTDDALLRVITSCREIGFKRIITVFGCGGNRDRGKRPLMGDVAARGSDEVIVTSDNPREEEPRRIALDIELGIQRAGYKQYEVILDREKAIETALRKAHEGDVVIIAGKGHETYQIVGQEKIPFSDTETASRIIHTIQKKQVIPTLFTDNV